MPNHITNRFELINTSLERAKRVFDFIKSGEDDLFDFNKLIPEPVCLEYRENTTELKPAWYTWHIEQWGTKWNAYDAVMKSSFCMEFKTAWNHPRPVMIDLSLYFNDIAFEIKYADEDIGYNLGSYTLKNGKVILKEDIDDKRAFAMELVYGDE